MFTPFKAANVCTLHLDFNASVLIDCNALVTILGQTCVFDRPSASSIIVL